MTDEPNYDSKTMQAKMADDPIASPTKDQISGNTVMQKIRSLIDNYLGWSKEITDKVNSLEPGGGGKTYTAGDGIDISDDDVISNTDHTQTQTNTSDIASIRVSMSDMASSAALGAETEARKTADNTLQANIDKKQDKLSASQQSALDSGITSTKVQKYDTYADVKQNTLSQAQLDACNSGITAAKVNSYNTDISHLKISDAEHTETLADQATQLSAQATEITNIKSKDATQDSEISALKTKAANHDTEIQGLSESVVSDLTGTFTESSRTLKLSLERESAPSIDCSVVIPGGTGGGAVDSVNGKTGTVVLSAPDVLTTAQQGAVNSGITSAKVSTYDGYASTIAGKQDKLNTAQTNAVNSGITTAKVTTYDGYASTIAGKQDKLNTAQTNAVNSGITSAKVTTYDGYKSTIDAKADSSTVTQIQTAVGGCFNDASVSGNNLILSTVGGQQNTLTLPGGGGGASLPADGYYWEKIESNPGDWSAGDVVMLTPIVRESVNGSSWTSAITYGSDEYLDPNEPLPKVTLVIPNDKFTAVNTNKQVYFVDYSPGGVTLNVVFAQPPQDWISGGAIECRFIGFNGKESIESLIIWCSVDQLIPYGLYRLKKFS